MPSSNKTSTLPTAERRSNTMPAMRARNGMTTTQSAMRCSSIRASLVGVLTPRSTAECGAALSVSIEPSSARFGFQFKVDEPGLTRPKTSITVENENCTGGLTCGRAPTGRILYRRCPLRAIELCYRSRKSLSDGLFSPSPGSSACSPKCTLGGGADVINSDRCLCLATVATVATVFPDYG